MDLPPPHPDPDQRVGQVPETATSAASAGDTEEERRARGVRRRQDRGGRRRVDWPEDAGMTGCVGCGHEGLQSLGTLDSGEYLWACPKCDRTFRTSRAARCML